MFIPLGLALLGHSSMVTGQMNKMGRGLKVYHNTGSLDTFKGVNWRHNGEIQPWGHNPDLDFVPTIRDEAAVEALEVDPSMWSDLPEVTSVFSLAYPYGRGNTILAADAVKLQKRIASQLKTVAGGGLLLGAPSLHGQHDHIDGLAYEWMKEWLNECNGECLYDFIAFDFEGDDVNDLELLIEWLHSIYERPIWITRLSCATRGELGESLPCTADIAQTFMKDSIEYFRRTDFVERWAWDGASLDMEALGDPSGMLSANGELNSLGQLYLVT